jgi:hypothetical protein
MKQGNHPKEEQTLVLLKPDAVQHERYNGGFKDDGSFIINQQFYYDQETAPRGGAFEIRIQDTRFPGDTEDSQHTVFEEIDAEGYTVHRVIATGRSPPFMTFWREANTA